MLSRFVGLPVSWLAEWVGERIFEHGPGILVVMMLKPKFHAVEPLLVHSRKPDEPKRGWVNQWYRRNVRVDWVAVLVAG